MEKKGRTKEELDQIITWLTNLDSNKVQRSRVMLWRHGKTNTIREFCDLSFQELGIKINWKGKGENEVGLDASK